MGYIFIVVKILMKDFLKSTCFDVMIEHCCVIDFGVHWLNFFIRVKYDSICYVYYAKRRETAASGCFLSFLLFHVIVLIKQEFVGFILLIAAAVPFIFCAG